MVLYDAHGHQTATYTVLLVPYVTAIGCFAAIGCSVGAYFINRNKFLTKQNTVGKKSLILDIVASIIVLAVLITGIVIYAQPIKLQVQESETATLNYANYGIAARVDIPLSISDQKEIIDILNEKELYLDIPHCIFTESYSVTIGNQTFQIGWDESGVIRYQTRYLYLNSDEASRFFDIIVKNRTN